MFSFITTNHKQMLLILIYLISGSKDQFFQIIVLKTDTVKAYNSWKQFCYWTDNLEWTSEIMSCERRSLFPDSGASRRPCFT